MVFDIQINIKVDADNELEAEKLLSNVMNDTVQLENKLQSWEFVEYIPVDEDDIPF